MSDIAEFLAARLDEDEQVARSATSSPWRIDERHPHVILEPVPIDSVGVAGERYDLFTGQLSSRFGQAKLDVVHIVRHDPARVLAEVAAKRAIFAEHALGNDRCDEHDASMRSVPCPTLLALVSVYADHPDYDSAWSIES